ncbi:unnamed protein product [Euphydryas editha]|uniref:Reverse transcriptase/retrotransposon-derived protein RNase H-like domain-containing protein n=1 Tax=Euphydryas editha TaxID=104508 RepID=A0AAU9UIZ6_EUPED|nr:unnamed protein product [Euphydryas editha]
MSLFDLLGFASAVTVRAKQLLQEVWRRGTTWDKGLPEDLTEEWKAWMTRLQSLNNVAIPRLYLEYSDAVNLQLHVFTDASESAYSAVLYWRATTPTDKVYLSLIIAKAKVAQVHKLLRALAVGSRWLEPTSIPRLELQAALMKARLAEAVLEEHPRKPDSKTYWTDSKTVLTWIKTGSWSYKL